MVVLYCQLWWYDLRNILHTGILLFCYISYSLCNRFFWLLFRFLAILVLYTHYVLRDHYVSSKFSSLFLQGILNFLNFDFVINIHRNKESTFPISTRFNYFYSAQCIEGFSNFFGDFLKETMRMIVPCYFGYKILNYSMYLVCWVDEVLYLYLNPFSRWCAQSYINQNYY